MRELIKELVYKNFREVLNSSKINGLENTVEMNKKRLKESLIAIPENIDSFEGSKAPEGALAF